jgi:hypothetical protein
MTSATLPVALFSLLYVIFVIKHFLADFLFQTGWMAIGKGQKREWVKPLVIHSGIHALMTLAIALVFLPALWWLCLVDFVVHGCIDRAKGYTTRRLGVTEKDSVSWWLLGIDQAAHQLTHYCFIVALVLVH